MTNFISILPYSGQADLRRVCSRLDRVTSVASKAWLPRTEPLTFSIYDGTCCEFRVTKRCNKSVKQTVPSIAFIHIWGGYELLLPQGFCRQQGCLPCRKSLVFVPFTGILQTLVRVYAYKYDWSCFCSQMQSVVHLVAFFCWLLCVPACRPQKIFTAASFLRTAYRN